MPCPIRVSLLPSPSSYSGARPLTWKASCARRRRRCCRRSSPKLCVVSGSLPTPRAWDRLCCLPQAHRALNASPPLALRPCSGASGQGEGAGYDLLGEAPRSALPAAGCPSPLLFFSRIRQLGGRGQLRHHHQAKARRGSSVQGRGHGRGAPAAHDGGGVSAPRCARRRCTPGCMRLTAGRPPVCSLSPFFFHHRSASASKRR